MHTHFVLINHVQFTFRNLHMNILERTYGGTVVVSIFSLKNTERLQYLHIYISENIFFYHFGMSQTIAQATTYV